MIWLEKGRIVFDGDPKEAVKAYEDSIRQQEEARLRAKSLLALRRDQPNLVATKGKDLVQVEVASPDGRPLGSPVWFRSVRLLADNRELLALPLIADDTNGASLDREGTRWGDVGEWHGTPARPMQDFGSPFHRVAGTFASSTLAKASGHGVTLALDWGADTSVELLVTCRMANT